MEAFRFAYFSRASLDYITKSGKQPDVLHTHNWETAIVGPLFWDIFAKQVQVGLFFSPPSLNGSFNWFIAFFLSVCMGVPVVSYFVIFNLVVAPEPVPSSLSIRVEGEGESDIMR